MATDSKANKARKRSIFTRDEEARPGGIREIQTLQLVDRK